MPLNGLTLMKGATSCSTVGGVSTIYDTDGTEVKNGIHLADMSETNFLVRSNITFKNRNPVLQSDGTWTKAKRSCSYVQPKTLADLSTAFNVGRWEIEFHPESTDAEILDLKLMLAQAIMDADVDAFISGGSLA